MLLPVLAVAFAASAVAYTPTVNPYGPFPETTEKDQYGTNNCGTADSPAARCQTLYLNSATDFCLWAPPIKKTIGDSEEYQVSWCTAPGHGSRLVPRGAITGAHWVETEHYIQITGTGDFTKMNIPKGDEGGELDPHGADGEGNPHGGLVIATLNGQKTQIFEWTEFIAANEFCIRACKPGPDAARYCNHIYDLMGCYWNEPGNYSKGSYTACKGDDVAEPMGEYKRPDGSTSTWYQGEEPTPSAQPPPKSSQCSNIASPGGEPYPTANPKNTRRNMHHHQYRHMAPHGFDVNSQDSIFL